MSIPQGHEAVTQDELMAQMRDSVTAQIRAWMVDIERMTTVVVCHPDDEARIQAAIDGTEFPGLFRVAPVTWVDPGTMLVCDSKQLWSGQA